MTDVATVVDDYIAMWNEPDAARRREIIAATWTADASYVDPVQRGDGHDGIDAMVARARRQFPGHRFQLSFGPDAFADRLRFAWRMVPDGGGDVVAAGVDFATLAPDGRLRSVTGFLEQAG